MPTLLDGQSATVQGSARDPYVLKNTGGVYSCTCTAWKMQHVPIEKRTCKHLKKYLGEAVELARVGLAAPTTQSVLPSSQRVVSTTKTEVNCLLAHPWDGVLDPTGYYMSEKLDGVRAIWTGKMFVSRLGNELYAPDWFTSSLPEFSLDGELWLGRKMFQKTISVVKRQDRGPGWKNILFRVFDAPDAGGMFESRMLHLTEYFNQSNPLYAKLVNQQVCNGISHLRQELSTVQSLGGEGLMLRKPGSVYERCRSQTLLKVKEFFDAEARVVGHTDGKKAMKGMVGALECIMDNDVNFVIGGQSVTLKKGTTFRVGTGLDVADRRNPPAVGSNITFRFQELTDDLNPRFPSFVCRRDYE